MGPGSLIGGKYRINHRIGQGGMGVVWAGVHELTDREVAIKLIPHYAIATEMLKTRLLREARACGRISHRNVVDVLDVGQTDDGDPFLVMPRLQGDTLAARLRRDRKLDPFEAAQIAAETARGLAAAHAAGIVHRDLKPSNLMLHVEPDADQPVVKVLDFGISKILTGEEGSASSVGIIGSPGYMSPEQIRCERLDSRSDLWSLGVILFEMLTGNKPFRGDPTFVMAEVLAGPIPRVADVAPEVPAALSDVVASCLVRDPKQRVASAAEVAAALRPFGSFRTTFENEPTREIRRGAARGDETDDATTDSQLAEALTEPPTVTAVLIEDEVSEDAATIAIGSVADAHARAIQASLGRLAAEPKSWPQQRKGRFAMAAFIGLGIGTAAALLLLIALKRRAAPGPAAPAATGSAASPRSVGSP